MQVGIMSQDTSVPLDLNHEVTKSMDGFISAADLQGKPEGWLLGRFQWHGENLTQGDNCSTGGPAGSHRYYSCSTKARKARGSTTSGLKVYKNKITFLGATHFFF